MKNVKPGHDVPVVCLDAGHAGKYNRSPVVPEYYESDMNWKLHLLLKAELEKRGIKVITTRPDQATDLALEKRGKLAQDADLFESLHSNAAEQESTDYVVAMYQVDDHCGEMDKQSLEIASRLSSCVAEIMGVKARVWASQSDHDRDGNGYKDDYYGVLRGAHSVHTPGVIVEHGFHTNPEQARWLLDEGNLQKLAEAEAEAICQYFDWQQEEPEHWYRIRESWDKPDTQVGAYKDPEAAKAACPVGYSVYNWEGDVVYTNTPAPAATNYTLTLPMLQKGDKGRLVKALQQLLLANDIKLPRYGADGDFGDETKVGVISYQKKVGLSADGVAGPATMGSLLGLR